jgi:hypothetical protein
MSDPEKEQELPKSDGADKISDDVSISDASSISEKESVNPENVQEEQWPAACPLPPRYISSGISAFGIFSLFIVLYVLALVIAEFLANLFDLDTFSLGWYFPMGLFLFFGFNTALILGYMVYIGLFIIALLMQERRHLLIVLGIYIGALLLNVGGYMYFECLMKAFIAM